MRKKVLKYKLAYKLNNRLLKLSQLQLNKPQDQKENLQKELLQS